MRLVLSLRLLYQWHNAMGRQVTCSPADLLEADNSTGLMSRATVATTAAAELASW
jgi:hypothetical protein